MGRQGLPGRAAARQHLKASVLKERIRLATSPYLAMAMAIALGLGPWGLGQQ